MKNVEETSNVLNIPWIESPFFSKELGKRTHLTPENAEYARSMHEDGFVVLKGVIDGGLIDEAVSQLNSLEGKFSFEQPREGDLWTKCSAVKDLAVSQPILDVLGALYEREPIPFQTLNFKYGSRQKAHSDTIHFHSFPKRFMCAAWVALEDMDEDNGTIVYYPKSHKLPTYDFQDLSSTFRPANDLPESFYAKEYQSFVQELIEEGGFEKKTLIVKKGDVLIWSANLLHGGLPVQDNGRTRWSQVTHYFFDNCLYYTPQWSNPICGEWFLRDITNIKTGERLLGSYNGHVPQRKAAMNYRYLLSPEIKKGLNDLKFYIRRLRDR